MWMFASMLLSLHHVQMVTLPLPCAASLLLRCHTERLRVCFILCAQSDAAQTQSDSEERVGVEWPSGAQSYVFSLSL